MGSRRSDSQRPEELRRQAEARVRETEEDTDLALSTVDAKVLMHELQVHQIELEMQNEELIRARAEAEEVLDRYADLYDFAPIGYFTLDHHGWIVESNLAGADLLCVPRSALANTSFRYYVEGDSHPDFDEFLNQMLETGGRRDCRLRLKCKGKPGPYVRLVGSATEGTLDRPRQCRVAAVDVSDRVEAERKLKRSYDELEDRVEERTSELSEARAESERRAAELQSVLASMADAVMLTDANGDTIYVNDACMEILGAPSNETFEDWLDRFQRYTLDGELLPRESSATCRALRGEIVRNMDVRGVAPWGNEFTVSISASPVRDQTGRILGATIVFHDISGRVEFERQRQELLEREHHIAEVLQQALVPPERQYHIDGCRISVVYEAAAREAEVGGDFYDVFEVGDGKIAIVIGDVVGKGLAAAIRVAAARHAIRSYAFLDPSPASVLTLANEALAREQYDDGAGMLTTIFAVVDVTEGTMAYASAGHEPPLIRGCDCGVEDLDHVGRVLGVLPGFAYTQTSCSLRRGDAVVMVTDGITEAVNARRELFGRDGVIEYLAQSGSAAIDDIAQGILERAKDYSEGRLRDDAAIIVFELV